MRIVTIGKKSFTVRALTWGEAEELEAQGLEIPPTDPSMGNKTMKAVFERILATEELETLQEVPFNRVLHDLWSGFLAEHFGNEEEEKNLLTGGAGAPPSTPPPAPSAPVPRVKSPT